jgi:hypothetical protein
MDNSIGRHHQPVEPRVGDFAAVEDHMAFPAVGIAADGQRLRS